MQNGKHVVNKSHWTHLISYTVLFGFLLQLFSILANVNVENVCRLRKLRNRPHDIVVVLVFPKATKGNQNQLLVTEIEGTTRFFPLLRGWRLKEFVVVPVVDNVIVNSVPLQFILLSRVTVRNKFDSKYTGRDLPLKLYPFRKKTIIRENVVDRPNNSRNASKGGRKAINKVDSLGVNVNDIIFVIP